MPTETELIPWMYRESQCGSLVVTVSQPQQAFQWTGRSLSGAAPL